MNRQVVSAGLAVLLAALVAGGSPAAPGAAGVSPAGEPSPEARLVAELYGKRIAAAMASADPADNVSLARELLTSAADTGSPAMVRQVLAMEALRLTSPVGTAEAARLAGGALDLADQLKPLEPLTRLALACEIARRRYHACGRDGTPPGERDNLAAAMIAADLGLARELMPAGRLEEANGLLTALRPVARDHRLGPQAEEIEKVAGELRLYRARAVRLAQAELALKRATVSGAPETIKAARQGLGLIYLLTDGDLATAAGYLSGTAHAYAPAVDAAAAFLKDRKTLPDAEGCNDLIESLGRAAEAAENERAKVRIATAGMAMCEAFLAAPAKGLAATKARLLLMQMQRLAGQTAADKLIRRLKAAYGGLDGKIEVLADGTVRVSYDFSDPKQLGDWVKTEGNWAVAPREQALIAAPQRWSRARLESRLRLRADKPMSLGFRASGAQDLNCKVSFTRDSPTGRGTHDVLFALGAGRTRSYVRDGWQSVWSNQGMGIQPGANYQIKVAWDGQGGFTWSVNGKTVNQHQTLHDKNSIPRSPLHVTLETHGLPAGFDDVVIEGTVLEKPE